MTEGDRRAGRSEAAGEEMREWRQGVGKAVEALRVSHGWSRDYLAQRAGLSRSTVLKIEQEARYPGEETTAALAGALGLDAEELRDAAWVAAAPNAVERSQRISTLTRTAGHGRARAGAALTAALGALSGRVGRRTRRGKSAPDLDPVEAVETTMRAEIAERLAATEDLIVLETVLSLLRNHSVRTDAITGIRGERASTGRFRLEESGQRATAWRGTRSAPTAAGDRSVNQAKRR